MTAAVEDARIDRDGRTHDANCFALRGHHDCAIAEVNRLRAKNSELNRRCSRVEAGLVAKIQSQEQLTQGRTFGRVLANSAWSMLDDRISVARALALDLPESEQRDRVIAALDWRTRIRAEALAKHQAAQADDVDPYLQTR